MMVTHKGRSLAPASPDEILLPARPWFILLTLFLGLLGNLLPLSGVAQALKPDFLALVILYWCIQEPRYVGVGMAWTLGLLMEVGDATLFGQHALAYAVLAYGAEYFRSRGADATRSRPGRVHWRSKRAFGPPNPGPHPGP